MKSLASYRPWFTLLALSLLVASCATVKPPLLEGEQGPLENLESWVAEGKLGFRSPEKNGSAWIHWRQHQRSYRLQLTGPFGAATTRIDGDPQMAVLSQSGREDIRAANGRELSELLFGWAFPVDEMIFWMKGAPAPRTTIDKIEYSTPGLLSHLSQQGWQLDYTQYQRQGQWLLPTKIVGRHGDYAFTLVVKRWLVPDSSSQLP